MHEPVTAQTHSSSSGFKNFFLIVPQFSDLHTFISSSTPTNVNILTVNVKRTRITINKSIKLIKKPPHPAKPKWDTGPEFDV